MKNIKLLGFVFLYLFFLTSKSGFALDTDIYKAETENNAYLLMDNSGSMSFGVYEHTIDYGDMFDYFFTLNDSGKYTDYIYDEINGSSYFYQNHEERKKIYLWKGKIGVTIATVNGAQKAFTGDAADPSYLWYMSALVDTHTVIDEDGNLADDGTGFQRITVAANGEILLDGKSLPLGQDISLHKSQTLYDGSVIDTGFGGLLNAPGYYFSGYEGVTKGNLDKAEDGDDNIYFFVTGNWVNMQSMYNLQYTTNSGIPSGASKGDMAWVYEDFPITNISWLLQNYDLQYPALSSGKTQYANNLSEADTAQTITQAGASRIQVHFSSFDIEGDSNNSSFTYDYLALYDENNSLVAKYDNDNKPTTGDGWSATITGDTVTLKLHSDYSVTGAGYAIDKIRIVYSSANGNDVYRMQSRLDVAKDAMTFVVNEFTGKINWGFASFQYTGNGSGNGASILSALNPSLNDDANRQAILQHISNVSTKYGTPLGEALQDIFEDGYYGHRNSLNNIDCAKNYLIVMSDGFPSSDDDWSRIKNIDTFKDYDGDGWTEDPYQYNNPPEDYYDDVAHWMYTHSWQDKSQVSDPANSFENIVTHHISFGAYHPLLEDAAEESGGQYIAAYNKAQLVSAFYSLGLLIQNTVSFTAPVVSVDAANKIQSGDDLYMGLFLPKSGEQWIGNLKKFKLGQGCQSGTSGCDRPDLWMIYDADNNNAIDSTGTFLDNTSAFWGDDTDANDSDSNGGADITEDGVGEVLLERVTKNFADANYWERNIYAARLNTTTGTYKLDHFVRSSFSASDLGVADDSTKDKVINYTHGFTYEADATSGAPVGVRSWVLGPIIHSRPVIIDYYDTTDKTLPLLKRYIAVGANDGMLHIFDDDDGKEVFAFIPEDILPKLKDLPLATDLVPTVDGEITVYRRNGVPQYLIFGERRGGQAYWCLDISKSDPLLWTVKWKFTNNEIAQSWSDVQISSVPVSVDKTTGKRTYKDVAIFTAGYDPKEDFFPEPFDDLDLNGSPYDTNGQIIDTGSTKEWDKTKSSQDYFDNDSYDKFNPGKDSYGRGIFVVDLDNPAQKTVNPTDSSAYILPFTAMYGATNTTTGNEQTFTDMQYSFPASPSLVNLTDVYSYSDGKQAYQGNVLKDIYATDIYTNIFKFSYDVEIQKVSDQYSFKEWKWNVKKIFASNPGSNSFTGEMGTGFKNSDTGRKSFYSPSISWGGSGEYFDKGNYQFLNTEFSGKEKIASLMFGTGDREHPGYTFIRNRFYAVYDDTAVSAVYHDPDNNTDTSIQVSTDPYTEDDLLNVTGDEFDNDTVITSCYLGDLGGNCDETIDFNKDGTVDSLDIDEQMKSYLAQLLTDDPIYWDTTKKDYSLEDGAEDDAKGWYIVLEDQGYYTSHLKYSTTLDDSTTNSRDNHKGEKILGKPVVFYKNIYFTSYQPALDDPCNPQGNGFSYALNYLDGSSALDLNTQNNGTNQKTYDISDRYKKYTNIYGIPSGFTILTRNGKAAAMASMGGAVIGPGEGTAPGYEIPSPGLGMELYYWRDGLSE